MVDSDTIQAPLTGILQSFVILYDQSDDMKRAANRIQTY
jgi:hypothetical protein